MNSHKVNFDSRNFFFDKFHSYYIDKIIFVVHVLAYSSRLTVD